MHSRCFVSTAHLGMGITGCWKVTWGVVKLVYLNILNELTIAALTCMLFDTEIFKARKQ